MPVLPSGEQVVLTYGEQRAVVVEIGGGLREYTVGGRHVVDSYGEHEMASSGRGQVLLPWPNRIEDGSYEFDGRRYQLALTEPARHNASHGLVRWAAWSVAERSASRVTMRHLLRPQPGYPFVLDVRMQYELGDRGLEVTSMTTNTGDTACPFGSGAHPYLTLGVPIDGLDLQLPARTYLDSDARGLPTGRLPAIGSAFDFRKPRRIGETKIDHAFTDLERDADGCVRVRLSDSASGDAVTVWADESYPYVMVFTGDTLATGARRGLAVEPMTCAPNAFRTGEGVIRLEPGETHTSTWGIEATIQ